MDHDQGQHGYESVLADATRVLDEVDRALVRLDEGTYDTCEVCGDAIDDARLAVHPALATCAHHGAVASNA
jgi:RNA polymerase-binding transcription factor DksA